MRVAAQETGEFRRQLSAALDSAIVDLFGKISDEELYAFSLYTSNETDFTYVSASANTEEGLKRTIHRYIEGTPECAKDPRLKQLRWSTPDWEYHNFSEKVEALELPDGEGRKRDAAIYRDFVYCLRKLTKMDVFSKANPRVMFLITCGDISERFFQKGMRQLNEPEMVRRYIEEFTAAPYLDWLRSLPAETRVDKLLTLYHDLALGIPSMLAVDAAKRNVNEYELRPLLTEIGEHDLFRLLELIERYGFGAIFNKKGSPAYDNFGAFTAENRLCTSTVFLVSKCPAVDENHIRKLQEILYRRVEEDRDLSLTSTLAENIARILHHLRPGRFPNSKMNPNTNHLENPDPFLRG